MPRNNNANVRHAIRTTAHLVLMIHSPCSDTALLHLADDRQQTREWLRSTSRRPNLVDMNLRPRRISPRPPIGGYRSAEEVRQRDSKIPHVDR